MFLIIFPVKKCLSRYVYSKIILSDVDSKVITGHRSFFVALWSENLLLGA